MKGGIRAMRCNPVKWGIDMQSEHERWLTETYIGRPVAVMNYPKDIKAFYMRQNDDGKTVAATEPCRTRASASASNAPSSMRRVWRTSGM